ncbi:MAG: ribose-5-phosphate isomerase A [archaeon]
MKKLRILITGSEGFIGSHLTGWDFTKYKIEPPQTELGHYIVETEMDDHLLIDEMDQQARLIPGVLETGFFIGSADRILMVGDQEIKVKSRMEYGR